jgi:D-sedoheptulose 7-phosphate isomerase
VTTSHTDVLRSRLQASIDAKQAILSDPQAFPVLDEIASAMVAALRGGNTVFFAGNGGSSTDAQHLSAELLGRFYRHRAALPSINLSDNTAAVTAIANDYSYDEVFARQLSAFAREGDVLIGLSTSGNSRNVVRAVEEGNARGLTTVGFTGATGGRLAEVAKLVFLAPSTDTPRIQECHLHIGHTLCEIAENALHPAR